MPDGMGELAYRLHLAGRMLVKYRQTADDPACGEKGTSTAGIIDRRGKHPGG